MRENTLKKPTLASVARDAGVSVATASYVLSRRADVTISAATRARVEECAERLGYRRNAFAAALRSGSSSEIGVYSSSPPHGATSEFVFALAEEATARGMALVVHIGAAATFKPSRFESFVTLEPLPFHGLGGPFDATPHVGFGTGNSICQVYADNFGGARRAVEHLLSLGHRRIGHFAGPQSELVFQERLRGFLDAVHEAGLRMDATPVFHSLADLATVLGTVNRPTAVLAQDDEGAVALYRCAQAAKLRVPTDLSIVGFGDDCFASKIEPPLTTIRVDTKQAAKSVLDLLQRQLARETVPTQTLLQTHLVVRESTAQLS